MARSPGFSAGRPAVMPVARLVPRKQLLLPRSYWPACQCIKSSPAPDPAGVRNQKHRRDGFRSHSGQASTARVCNHHVSRSAPAVGVRAGGPRKSPSRLPSSIGRRCDNVELGCGSRGATVCRCWWAAKLANAGDTQQLYDVDILSARRRWELWSNAGRFAWDHSPHPHGGADGET